MTAAPCSMTTLVDRHFAARIRPADEHALREHLPGCDTCRMRYDRRLLLAGVDPMVPGIETRLAVGLGLRPRRRRAGATVAMGTLAACLAGAAVVLLAVMARPTGERGFVARGAGDVALWVFRMDGDQATPVRDTIGPDTELAFAYQNGAGKRFLLVYGTDELGRVYWYHPAWTREADDPTAVAIEPGGLHELGEAVRHRLEGRHLVIHAVFTDEPLTVRQVEARLLQAKDGSLGLAGGIERTLQVEVVR